MSKTTWDLLCDCLDDLSADEYKKFTDKLLDSREEPRIRRRALEGKDPGDVARKIIETYTEPRAIQITCGVLRAVQLNRAAEDLAKMEEERRGIPANADNNPGRPEGAAFIQDNEEQLIQRTTGVDAILDALKSKKILNDEQYDDIHVEKTTQRKMRALLTGPIRSSGDTGRSVLYKILMKQQYHMMEDLGAHNHK